MRLFIFFEILILWFSCKNKNHDANLFSNKDTLTTNYDSATNKNTLINVKTLTCVEDSSINNTVRINNSENILKAFGSLENKINKSDTTDWDIYYSNENNELYLRLLFFPEIAENNNDFGMIEVGQRSAINEKNHYNKSGHKDFITDSGIKIGLSLNNFYKIKGEDFEIRIPNDREKYLIHYCSSGYVEDFLFEDEKLIKFAFGYPRP